MRAFLQCFATVIIAFVAVVLAISNGASALKLAWSVVRWIEHAPRELGHQNALLLCAGAVLLGALLISAHRHLGDRVPGDTKWLLGGGITALSAALVLAFDLSGPHRRAQPNVHPPERPPITSAQVPQPGSGGEGGQAPPRGAGGSTAGTAEPVDYVPGASSASEPLPASATAHDAALYVPSAEARPPEQEAEGPGESAGEEEESPPEEESAQPEATAAQTESSPAPTVSASTTVASSTSTTASVSVSSTAAVSVSSTAASSEAAGEVDEETTSEDECSEE